jgi:hypothetical protein
MEGRLTYLEKSLEDQRNESRELRESLRHLDQKVDGVRVELVSQVAALDAKMTSQFKWLVGINVTMWSLTVTVTVTVMLVGLEKIALR